MELGLVTTVERQSKLQLAISSPTIAIQIDLPEEVNPIEYFSILSARVASDIRYLSSKVDAAKAATVTLRDNQFDLLGDEMSERIAKLEISVNHLVATVSAMDAKLDLIVNNISDVKSGNAAVIEKFVEYDKKLDKKPSKDEVEKLLSQSSNKQILWTIGTLIALALVIYKILSP